MLKSISELLDVTSVPQEIVVDTEHLPDCPPQLDYLLGVSVAWEGSEGVYIPVNHWEGAPSSVLVRQCSDKCIEELAKLLKSTKLSGWNIEHDRLWIDKCFGIESKWQYDGRVLWYLSDKVQKERGYGLKRAQVELLGWEEAGDRVLSECVTAAGGSLSKGQHYLAPMDVLGHYAELDAKSTLQVILKILTEKDPDYDLLSHHDSNVQYAHFLAKCEQEGVLSDEIALRRAIVQYQAAVGESEQQLRNICREAIEKLETSWLQQRKKGYKTGSGWEALLLNPLRHPRFNPRSSSHRTQLLHDVLNLPITGRTETGLPKSDRATIATLDHPAAKSLVELSKTEKLLQFAKQYFEHSKDGRIHFPHNTVATITERLGGFAPYDLNMPFNSRPIMSAFSVGPGKVGIHMDLVSVEPCLIAGFSGDPAMTKVYRDGRGDIYLDLCVDLFPIDESYDYGPELGRLIRQFHKEYDPDLPPVSAQKEKFKKLRGVVKIVHLAVSYTGTAYTVSKNLTRAGFVTNNNKATILIDRYWSKFQKVARLSGQLNFIATSRGYIVGLGGRRLYVPKEKRKDALNTFAQHGGHYILREIVFEIDRTKLDGMRPLLPDIHDSTSWECPAVSAEAGIRVFEDAIRRVNERLGLNVPVRGEIKQFRTLFGLKGEE